MSDSYQVTFQWGAGAQTVCVAGNFNDWSATATPLHKQADGSFLASVPVPWGEKGAFKYVVDGEWKVREDEGKEWDAAGNMNNIYQAPSKSDATSSTSATGTSPTDSKPSHSGVGTATAAGAVGGTALGGAALHGKNSAAKDATPLASSGKNAPAPYAAVTSEKSAAPVQEKKTEPSNLIAANVPGSAVGAPLLGKPLTSSGAGASGALPVATHTPSENDKVVPIATTGTVPSPTSKTEDVPPSRLVATKDAALSKSEAAKDAPAAKSTSTDPAVHTGAGVSPAAGKLDAVEPKTAVSSDEPVDSKAAADKAGATREGEPKTLSPGPVPVVVPAPNAAASISGPNATVVKTTDPAGGVVGTAPEASPKEIEQVAKHANIGEAPVAATEGEEHGITERAAEYGAAAIGAIGGVLGGAVVAVEKATGVDIVHSTPLSVEEAQAKGIDVSTLDKVDGASDATVPTGQAPPASALAALDEKVDQLKAEQGPSATSTEGQGSTGVAAVPLPGGEPPKKSVAPKTGESTLSANAAAFEPRKKHSIPAQTETVPDNHQTIPAPVFTTVSPKDPRKDRSLNASESSKLQDTAGMKQVGDDPAVDAHEAKQEAEAHPGGASAYGQTGQADAEAKPEVQEAKKSAAPDTPANNLATDAGREGDAAKLAPQSQGAGNATVSQAGQGAVAPGAETGAGAQKGVTEAATGAPTTTTAPSTPAKKTNGATTPTAGADAATGPSTAASTPAKSTKSGKAETDGQVKKKSSFFSKIKHALKKDKK
ncbi:hypothetical protein IAR50_000833 [Cryptococcus sp. DSM 104548]